jgi:hypothetical protein
MYVLIFEFNVQFISIYYFLLVYQQIPQNFFQSNIEVLGTRMRRSVDYSDDITNESIHNDLNENSISPSLIESSMCIIVFFQVFIFSSNLVSKMNSLTTVLSSSSLLTSSLHQIASFSGKLVTGFNNSESKDSIKKIRSKRFAYEHPTRISSIMQLYDRLNHDPNLCEFMTEDELTMPGDVLNDVDIQFESQARLALTLSHFLSSFYQIINPLEDFPLRKAELELTDEQLIGEVLAAVGGDYKIVGIGIFFDRGKFPNYRLPYFGPYAFRSEDDISRKYIVIDWAGLPDGYENEIWFRVRIMCIH